MGFFSRHDSSKWLAADDVQGAYEVLRSFRNGAQVDRDELLRIITLLVLDMKEGN